MDMIEVKNYLRQIEFLSIKIEQRKKQRSELMQTAMSAGISGGDSEPVVHSQTGDRMSDLVTRCIDLEQEIDHLVEEYVTTKAYIIRQVQEIPDVRYEQILYKRYVECKTFGKISSEMGYEYKWICRVHGQALGVFYEMFLKKA